MVSLFKLFAEFYNNDFLLVDEALDRASRISAAKLVKKQQSSSSALPCYFGKQYELPWGQRMHSKDLRNYNKLLVSGSNSYNLTKDQLNKLRLIDYREQKERSKLYGRKKLRKRD